MKKLVSTTILLIILSILLTQWALGVTYLTPAPLEEKASGQLRPVSGTKLRVPLITWGGDVATILTETDGIFRQKGLDVELFREDNFAKQVDGCISGDSPFLRGTMGMINAAAPVMKAKGAELVVIYQMTWSVGGDAMVVRPGKTLKNISTVALQLYGPHMDYAGNLFRSANRLSKVQFKWMKELTLPTYDTTNTVDPVSAFQEDSSLDAVMCIIPDALMLTSGGTQGTGAEGSVKGATILLSTKTASRIIADVYAVRKDYYDKNKATVEKFVEALVSGEQALNRLMQNKSSQQAKYRQLLSKSADLLLGASQATADVEALLGDCEFVGAQGNVAFFTGKGTTRTLSKLNDEIQASFIPMGLVKGKTTVNAAGWGATAATTKMVSAAPARPKPKKKFDAQKVAAKVQEKISVEPDTWEEEGTLFVVTINFEPNQSEFTTSKYANDFSKALEISQTYNGALIVIEGHSDPLGILKAEKKREQQAIIEQMKQNAKNLSLQRSQAVRTSFLQYCRTKNIEMDDSQFVAVGLGIDSPEYNPPRTEQEWAANRRVVFRIKQVEAELAEFSPL